MLVRKEGDDQGDEDSKKAFPFFNTTVLNCSVCRLSSSVIAVCVSELSHLTPGMT